MPAKKGEKSSRKLFVLVAVFIILGAAVGLSLYLSKNRIKLSVVSDQGFSISQNRRENSKNKNEDQLSLYTIPKDVQTALNEAKTAGKPVLGIRADGPSYHIPVLMYHYVEHVKDPKDTIRISLNILPEVLDKQIQTLIAAHYNFINASDLADILDGIKEPPPNPVMLTFDDGYRDFYTDVFPILKKYNIKSVTYIISGFINRPDNLTDGQLKEIASSGIVEIGAHTVHHIALQGVSPKLDEAEITQSRIQLEQKLGINITAFAYPYGSFDINALQIVKQAGFRTAVSTIKGAEVSNSVRYLAYRVRPGAATGQSLLAELQSQ